MCRYVSHAASSDIEAPNGCSALIRRQSDARNRDLFVPEVSLGFEECACTEAAETRGRGELYRSRSPLSTSLPLPCSFSFFLEFTFIRVVAIICRSRAENGVLITALSLFLFLRRSLSGLEMLVFLMRLPLVRRGTSIPPKSALIHSIVVIDSTVGGSRDFLEVLIL